MDNWLFYKSECVICLILGVWYLFQTPVFSRLILKIFRKKSVRPEDRTPEIENTRIRLIKYGQAIVAATIAMKIIKATVLSVLQYRSFWAFLKPPFQPASYVLEYNFTHYWLNTLLTIFIAGIAFFFVQFLNQKYEKRFFYEEEYYFCAFGMLAIPWPWSLVYFSSVLFVGVLFHLIKISGVLQPLGRLLRKKSDNDKIPGLNANETFPAIAEYRFSFYYLWLSLALISIVILIFL